VGLAKDIGGGNHGFLAIQLPINAQMTEAFSPPGSRWSTRGRPGSDASNRGGGCSGSGGGSGGAAAAERAEQLQRELANAPGAQRDAAAAAAGGGGGVAPSPPPHRRHRCRRRPCRRPVVHDNMTVVEAAQKLGLAVFASGPLMEVRQQGCLRDSEVVVPVVSVYWQPVGQQRL